MNKKVLLRLFKFLKRYSPRKRVVFQVKDKAVRQVMLPPKWTKINKNCGQTRMLFHQVPSLINDQTRPEMMLGKCFRPSFVF